MTAGKVAYKLPILRKGVTATSSSCEVRALFLPETREYEANQWVVEWDLRVGALSSLTVLILISVQMKSN